MGKKDKANPRAERTFGEGNYQASRDFLKDSEKFQKTHSAQDIEKAGRDAAQAYDGPEGEALRKAEKKAGSHAKR